MMLDRSLHISKKQQWHDTFMLANFHRVVFNREAALYAFDNVYATLVNDAELHLIIATGAECKPSGDWGWMQVPQWNIFNFFGSSGA